jgi:DNA-binding transcriptional ArsR family regulator
MNSTAALLDHDADERSMAEMMQNARNATDLLKAVGHESRLIILCMLAEGERSVTELESILALRQPTVSQQLARLRADRLVETRRDGKTVYYSLASDPARQVVELLYDLYCAPKR